MPLLVSIEEKQEYDRLSRIAEIEARIHRGPIVKNVSVEPKREEWMLVPPTSKISTNGMTSRSFSKNGKESVDSSIWTASPLDRQISETATKKQKVHHQSSVDREHKKSIAVHNEAHRPKSLVEQFQEKPASNLPTRFDRDRDIAGKTLSSDQRDKLIQESKSLSSKFSHGSNSSFL
jgi:hypothetical protein